MEAYLFPVTISLIFPELVLVCIPWPLFCGLRASCAFVSGPSGAYRPLLGQLCAQIQCLGLGVGQDGSHLTDQLEAGQKALLTHWMWLKDMTFLWVFLLGKEVFGRLKQLSKSCPFDKRGSPFGWLWRKRRHTSSHCFG